MNMKISRYAKVIAALCAVPLMGAPALAEQAAEVNPAATVVYAHDAGNDSLDPHVEAGVRLRAMWPIYEQLIKLAPDGDRIPGLAESWEWVDPMTLQFNLRDGVTFHDGAPLNAEAVRLNFERMAGLQVRSDDVTQLVKAIDSVEVVSDLVVQLKLKEPNYLIEAYLVTGAGMMISPNALNNADLDVRPVGAGPYKIKEFRAGDRIVLSRFEDYWDAGKPRAAQLEIVSMPSAEARLNAVQSGQVHVANILASQLGRAQQAPGMSVITEERGSSGPTVFNYKGAESKLSNKLVRQAINHLISRDAVVASISRGNGIPTVQLFSKAHPAYSDKYPPEAVPYDVDKAKALLAEAGYPDGIDLKLLVLNREDDIRTGELLVGLMQPANVRLSLMIVDPTRFPAFRQGETDMALGNWRDYPLPDGQISMQAAAYPGGRNSPGKYNVPEGQKILGELSALPLKRDEKRISLLQRASEITVEEALVYPLFFAPDYYAVNECLVGFEPTIWGVEVNTLGVKPGC